MTHYRQLDAPIVTMASFNGQVVIATRKSLFFMGGQPYPGEADDAAITGDSSRAPEWRGDPQPVMTHGVFTEGDDFVFLESYRGKLYTWLGGRVAKYDSGTEEGRWNRMGPEGANCYGACVAGDWLVVSTASRYGGQYELWGFDGEGWWLLAQRTSSRYLWPCPVAGAGNRELLTFRDGGGTYDLFRLRWRSSSLHTYADSGNWTSSVIDGGDPTKDKAWMRMGATFVSPGDRGNTASVDSVTFPLEYSTDGGVTWTEAVSTAAAAGTARVLTREVAFETPPESRYLQLRQRWSSVSDWAPVLSRLWVEYELAEDYLLNELAAAEYAAGLAAEGLLRRKWELTVDGGDRNVRRDGQRDTKTGREAIVALWDAWKLGTELDFKDIDHDADPVTYLVQITGIEEKATRASDSARWGESQITLQLEESNTGLAATSGGVHTHDADYVNVTGDEMSGPLTINTVAAGSAIPLEVRTSLQGARFTRYSNDVAAPIFNFIKSRSATVAQGMVQNGDQLLRFLGQGSDGVSNRTAAEIRVEVDGPPGIADMPGRMLLMTSPDGGAIPVERVRIDSAGTVAVTGAFALPDGIAAPATAPGKAVLYVDSVTGDLCVKFGDGTVKTIVTDT